MERIICAAIWVQWYEQVHRPINIHIWYVIAGHRHHNCIETLSKMDEWKLILNRQRTISSNQWFLTSENRYVSRKEALEIAMKANQLIAKHGKDLLFSEDIY